MILSLPEKEEIKNILKESIRNKLQNYKPEPSSMPFHTRLLGKDRLALYSFIHSLNTNFGTSILEPVAVTLSKKKFKSSKAQITAGEYISKEAQEEIQKIIDSLTTAKNSPDKEKEIENIRRVCKTENMIKVKPTKVDVLLENNEGKLFLFDIKTAKPNAGGFREFKRTLLEWVAVVLSKNPSADIETIIAIPYNPYDPEPYSRWTMRGMIDLHRELKVADEFWDFLGGEGSYEELLKCFEEVGIEMRREIDDYFLKFYKK